MQKYYLVIGGAVSYRDGRTAGMDRLVSDLVPPELLYSRTDIQRQPFNPIYQLMALRKERGLGADFNPAFFSICRPQKRALIQI